MAGLLRSLASGLISNDQFEDAIPDSSDKAIYEVFIAGGWCLYSDLRGEYKLAGKDALDEIVRKEVAKWVLFLKSDYEYSWPKVPLIQRVIYRLTFGLYGMSYQQAWALAGDFEVWPFLKREHFDHAKETCGYLGR